MIEFISTILTAFGVAYVVGHAKISQRAREALYAYGFPWSNLVELIECPACFGFWYGLIVTQSFTWAFTIVASNYLLATFTGIMPKENK